jgi:hypothetical protein
LCFQTHTWVRHEHERDIQRQNENNREEEGFVCVDFFPVWLGVAESNRGYYVLKVRYHEQHRVFVGNDLSPTYCESANVFTGRVKGLGAHVEEVKGLKCELDHSTACN